MCVKKMNRDELQKKVILQIENKLDISEKVSLVFLVCDDPHRGREILSCPKINVLSDLLKWAHELRLECIHQRVVEALHIIQNYSVAKELCKFVNVCDKHSNHIKPMRKALYSMCESMTGSELTDLILLVRQEFEKEGANFELYDAVCMERNILFWLCQDYIKDDDVGSLIHHLQYLKPEIAQNLRCVKEWDAQENHIFSDNDLYSNDVRHTVSCCKASPCGDVYEMPINKMGICLIVNQRNFDKYAMKREWLTFDEVRCGTNMDREMLQITFTGLGYEVMIIENVDHKEFEIRIKNILRYNILDSHSSFVMCILSHGKRGAVYCVDAVPVKIEKIESWILGNECPQLLGKPKIVIIQACQGRDNQKVETIEERDAELTLETDGPKDCRRECPPTADLVTFWATVPGYASYRDPCKGSLFIQSLCRVLLEHGHTSHVADLFTKVNSVLSTKHVLEHGTNDCYVSMPQVTHTLRKMLYFPYAQEAKLKSAKLLFEKYLFERFFNEFIFLLAAKEVYQRQKAHNNS